MSDADTLNTLKSYIRRKWSLAKMKTEADNLFDMVNENEVTITSQGFEGGSANGVITCPKIVMLQAIEDLIKEQEPSASKPPSNTVHTDFSKRTIET